MPSLIFFGLLITSLIGVACSFFFNGIPFVSILSVSLIFPAAAFVRGLTVCIKRKMIMKFIAEEISNSASSTTKDLAYRYNRASNIMRNRAF